MSHSVVHHFILHILPLTKVLFLNDPLWFLMSNHFLCMLSCSVVSNSATPWTVAHQAFLSREFSRQEYWSGLPFPTSGNLLTQRVYPTLLGLLHFQADSLYHPCHLLVITLPASVPVFPLNFWHIFNVCCTCTPTVTGITQSHWVKTELTISLLYLLLFCMHVWFFVPPTNILSHIISLLSPYPVSHQFLLSYLLSINTFRSIFSLFLLPLFEFIPLLLVTCYAKKIAKSNIIQFLL